VKTLDNVNVMAAYRDQGPCLVLSVFEFALFVRSQLDSKLSGNFEAEVSRGIEGKEIHVRTSEELFRFVVSAVLFAFTLGVPVDIPNHSPQESIDARLVCGTINLSSRFGSAPIALDKLLVKSAEIDLFFLLRYWLILRDSWTDIVLNANAQHPAMGFVPRPNLENANLASLAQTLFFAII
jgi:hypothetical protein